MWGRHGRGNEKGNPKHEEETHGEETHGGEGCGEAREETRHGEEAREGCEEAREEVRRTPYANLRNAAFPNWGRGVSFCPNPSAGVKVLPRNG